MNGDALERPPIQWTKVGTIAGKKHVAVEPDGSREDWLVLLGERKALGDPEIPPRDSDHGQLTEQGSERAETLRILGRQIAAGLFDHEEIRDTLVILAEDEIDKLANRTIGHCFRSPDGTARSGASGGAGESVGSISAVLNPPLERRCPWPDRA
jgi:hypothetical protein